MELRVAKEIMRIWKSNDFPGRIKTSQVNEAEQIIRRLDKQLIVFPKKEYKQRISRKKGERIDPLIRQHLRAINKAIGKKSRKFKQHEKKAWKSFKVKIIKDEKKYSNTLHSNNGYNIPNHVDANSLQYITNYKIKIISDYIREQYKITELQLLEVNRNPKLVEARQIIMYMTYKHKLAVLKEIAFQFKRDHTTVMHANKSINDRLHVDKPFRIKYERYESEIMGLTSVKYEFNNFTL